MSNLWFAGRQKYFQFCKIVLGSKRNQFLTIITNISTTNILRHILFILHYDKYVTFNSIVAMPKIR